MKSILLASASVLGFAGAAAAEDPELCMRDADGDGYYAIGSCNEPATDCDDNDPLINPGMDEVCDGVDNNCNGFVDDEDGSVIGQTLYYADADGDGFPDEGMTPACVFQLSTVDTRLPMP